MSWSALQQDLAAEAIGGTLAVEAVEVEIVSSTAIQSDSFVMWVAAFWMLMLAGVLCRVGLGYKQDVGASLDTPNYTTMLEEPQGAAVTFAPNAASGATTVEVTAPVNFTAPVKTRAESKAQKKQEKETARLDKKREKERLKATKKESKDMATTPVGSQQV